jgi:curved DNA-binding protein CbpA
MDIERCFEILELDRTASIEEAKQAYREQVKFFHPDRFTQDPRQKDKAEKKLKEVNEAYEQIKVVLTSQKEGRSEAAQKAAVRKPGETRADPAYRDPQQGLETQHKGKAGTGEALLRNVGSFLSGVFRRITETHVVSSDGGPGMQRQGKGRGGGRGKGARRGRGGGKGRGRR